MKRSISQEELRELEKSGAKITKTSAAGKDETLATKGFAEARAIPSPVEIAMLELAGTLSAGQKAMLLNMQKMSEENAGIKPLSYRCTIKRSRRGLIETIDVTPLI